MASDTHCTTMAQVRENIDALDDQIVALLAQRTTFMTQAARIKQSPEQVHDQARIDFIVDKVRRQARALGMPEEVAEAAYRALIGASIEFERAEFARLRAQET
jgi:isochorismate pyruvate lyase